MNTCVKLLKPIEENKELVLAKLGSIAEELTTPLLLIGATARDILFYNMYEVETVRMTMDLDISVQLPDWKAYHRFGDKMRENDFINTHKGHEEKFIDKITGQEVDLLPFGELAEDGDKIVWPNDKSEWRVTGFKDALNTALKLSVIGNSTRTHIIPFVSAPALVLLKIISLYDRPEDRYQKDGSDIGFVIKNYLEIGNRKRLKKAPHAEIMQRVNSDIDLASAVLLGWDIRRLAGQQTLDYIVNLIDNEITSCSRCFLIRGMKATYKGDFGRAKLVLRHLKHGIKNTS